MKLALCHVQPRAPADLAPGALEMGWRRLVGAHLLGGDQQIELNPQPLESRRQQIVVDVRQHPQQRPGAAQRGERRPGVGEWRPARQAVGQEVPRGEGRCETEIHRHPARGLREDLAVGAVAPGLDRRLVAGVELEEPVLRGQLGTRRGGRPEGVVDSPAPVDQRAVTVEGQVVVAHPAALLMPRGISHNLSTPLVRARRTHTEG